MEQASGRTNALQNTRLTGLEGKRPQPDKMLRDVPRELLDKAAADVDYLSRHDAVLDVFYNYMQQKECHLLEPVSRGHKFAVAYSPNTVSIDPYPFMLAGWAF